MLGTTIDRLNTRSKYQGLGMCLMVGDLELAEYELVGKYLISDTVAFWLRKPEWTMQFQ